MGILENIKDWFRYDFDPVIHTLMAVSVVVVSFLYMLIADAMFLKPVDEFTVKIVDIVMVSEKETTTNVNPVVVPNSDGGVGVGVYSDTDTVIVDNLYLIYRNEEGTHSKVEISIEQRYDLCVGGLAKIVVYKGSILGMRTKMVVETVPSNCTN